jgi:small subunit ribosomal protein S1
METPMPNPNTPESQPAPEATESFGDLLSQFEQSHSRKTEDGGKQLTATVIAVSAESVFLDIGYKSEGILPLGPFQSAGEEVKPGDTFQVSVKGRDTDGYYELSRFKTALPRDWSALEKAFAEKTAIMGTVSGVVKGGFNVDVGVRAFMPASRSGTHDAAEMEKLVGQEIRCRIIKLAVTEEDVVVDRRVVTEEEERATKERRYSDLKEGDTVHGEVRSLADYGAFVDLGGVDGLLHVSDISWGRVNKPSDVLTVGQEIEARVLKIDLEKHRISLGLKQLQPHPWDSLSDRYKSGDRVRGTVTRVADFGAFVELEPGIEGLIHVSEMSWAKKVRTASDVVKPGDSVEAVILGVDLAERRISLGLKQALGDPWAEVAEKFPAGAVIQGPVTNIMKFGAFVQLAEGVEGLVHISEISAEKRINHPSDVLKLGQVVKALVLEVDKEKRQIKLSLKQLVPTGLDEFIAEHKVGDVVTGRLMEVSGGIARVELGEGIRCTCRMPAESSAPEQPRTESMPDLSSLSSMLKAKWKGGADSDTSKPEAARSGQIRSFRIARLDPETKEIALELAE